MREQAKEMSDFLCANLRVLRLPRNCLGLVASGKRTTFKEQAGKGGLAPLVAQFRSQRNCGPAAGVNRPSLLVL
jgi:hypothetical protein